MARFKISNNQKTKLIQRRYLLVFSLISFALVTAWISYFFFGNNTHVVAAGNDDYRSIASGNWNNVAIWERYSGSSWSAATSAPSNSNKTITIQSGHTVTVTANLTIDQTEILSGGLVVVNSGVTLTIAKGVGTDLSVTGTLKNSGTITVNSGAVINFLSGGTYQHNQTTVAGTIPSATWSANSNCEIIGYTTNTTAPSGLQNFYNFSWNCPAQTGTINLNGGLTTVSGNLNVLNTGSGKLYLSNTGMTCTVSGDFNQSGGSFSHSLSNSQTSNLNISGNYIQTGGIFSVADGTGSTGNVNLSGNFTHTGGTITVGGNASTNAQVFFKKSGTQIFLASGNTVTGNVDFTVNSGATLDMGTSILTGRNFTLSSGGGILIGAADGICSSGSCGNVQVIGSRNFNLAADYTYNGSVTQNAGNGLPATVSKLILNNAAGLSLSQSVSVSNTLTLTNGKITTGSYEVNVTNNSIASVVGFSSSNYIIGNLRRSVGANGKYDFPVGSSSNYELMSATLSACSGFSNLLGSFINSNPINPSFPLNGLELNDIEISSLLDHGYWKLIPNSSLSGGSYTVRLNETGYSNSLPAAAVYALVSRTNSSSAWTSVGTHNDANQGISGSTVYTERTGMTNFYEYAIGIAQYMTFASPLLISGTDGQANAIYKFPNVMVGVDAWVKIMGLYGGATLNEIDNSTTGYSEAFQPFINYPSNTDSYIEWLIMFKKAGTSVDTTIKKMTATGVDVDGGSSSGQTLREYIEATMPLSYSLDPATTLTISNNNGSYKALGSTATVNNIDTAARQAMYQLNYANVSSIMYKTGSITSYTSTQVRQTSLYFRSFNLTLKNIALPVELMFFKAQLRNSVVELNWSTASELNNEYFTIERSSNGEQFTPLKKIPGAGNSSNRRDYQWTDESPLEGLSYYRLRQTDFDGQYTFSEIQTVKKGKGQANIDIKSVFPNPFQSKLSLGVILEKNGVVEVKLIDLEGREYRSLTINGTEGYNTIELESLDSVKRGVYFVVLTAGEQKLSRKVVKE